VEREWLRGLHLPRLGRCRFQLADFQTELI
jgi:hypothetical protein